MALPRAEPEYSGSDPVMMGTTAVLDGDEWVISGPKWFATGARRDACLIVMAVTDPNVASHQRASMIIVPQGTPGLEIVRDVPVMGEHIIEHCELRFHDCRVPQTNLLGKRGAGFELSQVRLVPGLIPQLMLWIGVMTRRFKL